MIPELRSPTQIVPLRPRGTETADAVFAPNPAGQARGRAA